MIAIEVSVQVLERPDQHGITIDQDTGVITITNDKYAGTYTLSGFREHPAMPHDVEGRHTVWLRPVKES